MITIIALERILLDTSWLGGHSIAKEEDFNFESALSDYPVYIYVNKCNVKCIYQYNN